MFQDLADTKPSLVSFVFIIAMVVIGIPLLKAVVNRFPVPGLTPLVNAV